MATRSTDSRDDRRAAAAALREQQEKAERRRRRLLWTVVSVVVLALVIPVVALVVTKSQEQARVEAAAEKPIVGERDVTVGSAKHVTGDVPYDTSASPSAEPATSPAPSASPEPAVAGTRLPPVGGDHDPTPQNCGFYDQPVRDENAVHSLEHGAVWLAYRSDLDAGDVTRLKEIAQGTPYVLASPYDDLAAPIVATAWGVQLELQATSDERLDAFLARYVQGPQTPEPGAPCSGGVGTPIG